MDLVVAGSTRWILLSLVLAVQVQSFPTGAPASTCISGVPHHSGAQRQTTKAPYELRLSQPTYNPSDVITVTITSVSGAEIRGLVLRALQHQRQNEDLMGEFIAVPEGIKGVFFWPITTNLPRINNCVTHMYPANRKSVTVSWQAPGVSRGDLIFRATVVEHYEKFWLNGIEAILQATQPDNSITPHPYQVSGTISPALSLDGECGRTKGCLLYPDWCTGNDCRYAVSFKPDQSGSSVDIEVTAVTPGYVSFGISMDTAMPIAQTVTCVAIGDIRSIQNGFLPAFHHSRRPVVGMTNLQVDRSGDRVTCRFTRPMRMDVINVNGGVNPPQAIAVPFDLNDDWYLFLATGYVYEGSDDPQKHDALPLISNRKVKLVTSEIVRARSLYPALRAHASLGLASWMTLAAVAAIIARHYRPTLSRHVCGAAWWFQVHRASMLLMFIISMTGVILILAYNRGWRDHATIHGAFGLVAVGMGVIQILEGLLRPGITHPRRPIFNWIHRLGGLIGWTCAVICIFIALRLKLLDDSLRTNGTIIVSLWLVFYVIWDIVLEIVRCRNDRVASEPDPSGTKGTLSVQDAGTGNPSGSTRVSVVHVTLLVLGAVGAAIFLCVSLAFVNMT